MEKYTALTPAEVFSSFESYFSRQWDGGGGLSHPTPGTMQVTAQARTLIDSRLGILALIFLSIITGGVFFVLYMVYWLVFKDKSYYAAVTATREGSFTRISTQTNHSQWEEPLEEWAQELQPT
jgi:hypothetical protein